jgi:hypothetical protein
LLDLMQRLVIKDCGTELLKEWNIRIKMLAELRRFCPHRNDGYGGKKYQKRGALSIKLKRRTGPR